MARSPLRFSPSTGGFYHIAIHGDAMPADAVVITARRHRELLAGQAAARRIVAGADGRPELAPIAKPTRAELLGAAIGAIKREARRRILAIASLERQANDNAAIAALALQRATGSESAGDVDLIALQAMTRRKQIDAVRAASDALEAQIAAWSAASLSNFDAGAAAHWPTGA